MRFPGQPQQFDLLVSNPAASQRAVRHPDGPSKLELDRATAADRVDDTRRAIRDNGSIEAALGAS
jgi:hypothetical protein